MLNSELKSIITVNQAWFYRIYPVGFDKNVLQVKIDENRFSSEIISELEVVLGKKVEYSLEETSRIDILLQQGYPKASLNNIKYESLNLNVNAENFLENLVKEAKVLNSSDIHFECYGDKSRIRFRVDGLLIDRHKLSKSEYPVLINKIKIASGCDIAEKRLPQDGRIRLNISNSKLDIRVSILPTLYGEKIVFRLLGSDASHIELEKLGFSNEELARYNKAIQKPNGIILISGPTGSGKTTTLYATLKQLNKITSNIVTIEDPIEYTLDGINQVQLKEGIGLTYSEALRTFLRQDPDVIMLGEIRDSQTAQMAIRAALTGHLVLSTIHTNSAWGTISRLIDMNIPGYLLATTLNLSVAQRLIRTLCVHCKSRHKLDQDILPVGVRTHLNEHFISKGCEVCHHTGYKGRKAIYEVINIDKELIESIKANVSDIDNYCSEKRISKLKQNALSLFERGETSLDEIYPYLINES